MKIGHQNIYISQVSLDKCDECGKLMEEGTVIVNEKKFHPHCFVCVMCRWDREWSHANRMGNKMRESILSKWFLNEQGFLYTFCRETVQQLWSYMSGCYVIYSLNSQPWNWFLYILRKPLDGKFFTTSDGVLCEVDYKVKCRILMSFFILSHLRWYIPSTYIISEKNGIFRIWPGLKLTF